MAESKNNVIIHGFSGKIGDLLVFSQRAGKTIASKAPGERTQEPTAAQQVARDRFQRAILYGKAAVTDPAVKEEYQEKATDGKSAFNVAVADFFHAPDILEIDVSGYNGLADQMIRIKVVDDFKVKSVKLSILNEDGGLQEEGNAVKAANGQDWYYTATTTNAGVVGDKIIITATDNPDNLTTEDKTL